jgi:hypothetical protein
VQGRYLYRSCAFFCIYVYQGGFNGSVVAQIGNRNGSDVDQYVEGDNGSLVTQLGWRNMSTVIQIGGGPSLD